MKAIVIGALICLNLALLAAVVVNSATTADAQVRGGGSDYMMMTSRINSNQDAVYVIDLGERRMLAWVYNRNNRRLEPMFGRELTRDFR